MTNRATLETLARIEACRAGLEIEFAGGRMARLSAEDYFEDLTVADACGVLVLIAQRDGREIHPALKRCAGI